MSYLVRKTNRPTVRYRDPFAAFEKDFSSFFDDVFGSSAACTSPGSTTAIYNPSLDVEKTDNGYRVRAELPGVAESDVELTYNEGALTIKGEKKREVSDDKDGHVYRETRYGSFERSIPFEAEIDVENIEATFDKGVLSVALPVVEEQQPKTHTIDIKHG